MNTTAPDQPTANSLERYTTGEVVMTPHIVEGAIRYEAAEIVRALGRPPATTVLWVRFADSSEVEIDARYAHRPSEAFDAWRAAEADFVKSGSSNERVARRHAAWRALAALHPYLRRPRSAK